jgi:hypothetical protein
MNEKVKGSHMTEQEWLTCTDPDAMLKHLRGRITDRQCWLFAAACDRRVFPVLELVTNEEGQAKFRRAVELFERVADGIATDEEVQQLYPPDTTGVAWGGALGSSWNAAASVASGSLFSKRFCNRTAERREAARRSAELQVLNSERVAQSEILRCIVGNPFCPATIAPSCQAWNDGTVAKLAQGIHDDRAFDRLPILADALEEAGCDNADIINHCRQPGEHVRGCWVVDLLLNKS